MSYQLIIIQGNLTKNAETRQVGERSVTKIDIAVGRTYTKRDGTQVKEVEYFNNIEIWDKAAVAPYLVQGQSVLVQCRKKTDTYTGQDGQQRRAEKYIVDVIQLCGARPQQAQQPAAPAPPAPGYQQAPPAPTYQRPAAPAAPAAPVYQQAPPAPPTGPVAPPAPPAGGQYFGDDAGDLPF